MATVTLKRDRLGLSSKDRAAILAVMQEMLTSSYFSKSKRYPALLEFCVRNTLDGESIALKERVIGSEVFGRPANYDSSEDPVVRIAAGEVRKRIALYFDEHRDAPVRIDLPLGSYICQFHFPDDADLRLLTAEDDSDQSHVELTSDVLSDHTGKQNLPGHFSAVRSKGLLAGVSILCAALGFGVWHQERVKVKLDFWTPAFHKNVPALIVIGQAEGAPPSANVTATDTSQGTLSTEANRSKNQVETANAFTAAEICGVFRQLNRKCDISLARTASFEELRNKSIVLVGAFDNPWTERLLEPLRFHLIRNGTPDMPRGRILSIADRDRKAEGSPWSIDLGTSPTQMKSDYFVIARFHNETFNDDVLIAGGIWTHGTRSAGDYITSPEKMAELISLAPADWKGFNFEAVLQTEIVNGEPGNVKVLAAEFW